MPVTPQELIQIAKSKGIDTSTYEAKLQQKSQMPQARPQGTLVTDLLDKINPKLTNSVIGGLQGFATGKMPESNSDDYSKLYAQEAIKKQFEDPTVRQLREAEIEALGQPPPKGFVRVGKQTLADPDYIDPMEQRKIDEENRVKTSMNDSIIANVEQNLASISKAKEGAKYFGPFGDLPSVGAPSSLPILGSLTMGEPELKGEYGERQEWENNINQLLKQKVVDLIMEMKEASKTGATGFGQLSNQEGQLLQQASTALNKRLTPERAIYYLNEMERINRKILSGRQNSNSSNIQPNVDNDPLGIL